MTATSRNLFRPSDRMLRQFAGLWILVFGAIAAWQDFHHHRHVLAILLAVLSVTVGPLGLMWPRIIRPVFIGWMTLAYPMGWMVSQVVLGIIFYGLFTPVAWIFRIFGRDALGLKPQPHADTYWHPKPRAMDKVRYLQQF